jgi:uncharacterized small protein (DUF1192 family)
LIFRRKGRNGGAAVAEPAWAGEPRKSVDGEFDGTTEELRAEIERLTAANLEQRDRDTERRLLRLRHALGVRLFEEPDRSPQHPAPAIEQLPDGPGLPDIRPEQLTPELLRAGILRDGSVLVRGLIDRDDALGFAEEIERSFEERDKHDAGQPAAAGYYELFEPDPRFSSPLSREWITAGGGVLAVDSPMLAFDMLELFGRAGLSRLVEGYLGEPAAFSAQKSTLRKAEPEIAGAWHQDGAFMGPVRALNIWVSLSRCGDESPGLDIVPRRLDHLVASGTEGTKLNYQVSNEVAHETAGESGIVRPIFEPGDVLLFDDLCLHQTGSDPGMPKPRYAIESWFFGASGFPGPYAPLAL